MASWRTPACPDVTEKYITRRFVDKTNHIFNMPWPLEAWYLDVPIVTRVFITGAIATSIAVQCNWVTPFQLFFSWHSVIIRKQVGRFV
ncbi:hypothetical protein MERGE_002670 [Pneumocystis wakefieldiae]|uniref:Uncharacterized protein n=1 Tax=Pneumocystis wakefieldiae TaxID=38082 RepID=A0A899FMZ2_9ASCO|nr:hypothetical protein MERGE_002670 [Pneumocystis wakefieldiae]